MNPAKGLLVWPQRLAAKWCGSAVWPQLLTCTLAHAGIWTLAGRTRLGQAFAGVPPREGAARSIEIIVPTTMSR